ncbi:hypothetical protein Taro_021250 [Colocasia esculenta]|uniref:Uncharacterized protein n=1 Tax=Colocasia esculenta TaxID=4460 RepID=A0A843UYI8_COLES|nr:hypothetical protein [Colocasia esculenta]
MGKTLITEPYYPSRFARNFGYDQSIPPRAEFPLLLRLHRGYNIHLIATSWWDYFRRPETSSAYALPAPGAVGRVDIFYARWWYDRNSIFRLAPRDIRQKEHSRLEKPSLPLIYISEEYLDQHFSSIAASYKRRYSAKASPKADKESDEADGISTAPSLADERDSLLESPSIFHGEGNGSTLQAMTDLLPEEGTDGAPSDFAFSGMAEADVDCPGFTYTGLGVSREEYSSAPVEVYIPRPAEEPPVGTTSFGASFSAPNWGISMSPFLNFPAQSAFQVGDTTRGGGGLHQADSTCDPPTFAYDGEQFYSSQYLPSSFQDPCPGPSNLAQPSESEAEEEGEIPASGTVPNSDEDSSPPLEINAPPEHGIRWPEGTQPAPHFTDDGCWEFLVGRIMALADSTDPAPIEVIRGALEQHTGSAFSMGVQQERWMNFITDVWNGNASLARRDLPRIKMPEMKLKTPKREAFMLEMETALAGPDLPKLGRQSGCRRRHPLGFASQHNLCVLGSLRNLVRQSSFFIRRIKYIRIRPDLRFGQGLYFFAMKEYDLMWLLGSGRCRLWMPATTLLRMTI